MEYQTELLDPEIITELASLILSLYEEVGGGFDLELDPDWKRYAEIQEAGILKLFTVRDDNKLIGFTIYIISPMLHHKGYSFAMQDSIFLLPEYRGGEVGGNLLKYAEKKMQGLGVTSITAVSKVDFDFSPLLIRTGYVAHECAFIKKLT